MSLREGLSHLAAWSWVAALILWAGLSSSGSTVCWTRLRSRRTRLLDWHAYAAGGHQFAAGNLYRVDLVSPCDTDQRLQHAAGLRAGRALLPFPDTVGGVLWVIVNVAAVAAAAALTARIVDLRPWWLWSGAAFFAYSFAWWALPALLGNNSPLLLLMVAGFVAAHLASHDPRRSAAGDCHCHQALAGRLPRGPGA